MAEQPKSFLMVLMSVFKMPGQTTSEFAQEVRALSPEDKAWYRAELIKAGYDLIP